MDTSYYIIGFREHDIAPEKKSKLILHNSEDSFRHFLPSLTA